MSVEPTDWKKVHARLIEVAELRASLDYEEATLLITAKQLGVHTQLGLASLEEYVERFLGHEPRAAFDRVRVAEALGDLPLTASALRDGQIAWTAVRELTRILVADTEAEWLALARGRTVRDVERLVSGHLPGDLPSDVPSADARRHVLRLEVSGATLALFREAQAKLVRDSGGSLSDDDVMQLMARAVLGGPKDEGRSSYQIAVITCDQCGRGWQDGRGERIPVDPVVVEQASCDAQRVGRLDAPAPEPAKQDIPPAVRRQVLLRDHGRCVVPGCRNATWVDLHHLDPRADGGPPVPDNLITGCSVHHKALHEGRLLCEGRPSTGLRFKHADGTPYGEPPSAKRAELATDAFLAFKGLGFKEKEARRAVAQVLAHVGADAKIEEVIRQGLAVLCGHARPTARTG